jgi:hypothetical protein
MRQGHLRPSQNEPAQKQQKEKTPKVDDKNPAKKGPNKDA